MTTGHDRDLQQGLSRLDPVAVQAALCGIEADARREKPQGGTPAVCNLIRCEVDILMLQAFGLFGSGRQGDERWARWGLCMKSLTTFLVQFKVRAFDGFIELPEVAAVNLVEYLVPAVFDPDDRETVAAGIEANAHVPAISRAVRELRRPTAPPVRP